MANLFNILIINHYINIRRWMTLHFLKLKYM